MIVPASVTRALIQSLATQGPLAFVGAAGNMLFPCCRWPSGTEQRAERVETNRGDRRERGKDSEFCIQLDKQPATATILK